MPTNPIFATNAIAESATNLYQKLTNTYPTVAFAWLATNRFSVTPATNAALALASAGLWSSNYVNTVYPFVLVSNNVATFDLSVDGSHWTNRFSFAVTADDTNEVFGVMTNIDVRDWQWLRFVAMTNGNNGRMTNYGVYIGHKQGL